MQYFLLLISSAPNPPADKAANKSVILQDITFPQCAYGWYLLINARNFSDMGGDGSHDFKPDVTRAVKDHAALQQKADTLLR
jgi:hypothetical protein